VNRALDVAGASVGLVVSAPFLGLAAIAIKL
jgi:lipopolysaccharide/colanic/teichoic acid biosynthesis glycosyltransferase